jgi:hypothetical protein
MPSWKIAADLLRFDPIRSKMPGLPSGREGIDRFTSVINDYLALYMSQPAGDHSFLGYSGIQTPCLTSQILI